MQYEILRRQALETGENSNCNGLEQAFIESRGLAAWIAYVPPDLSLGDISVDLQTAEGKNPRSDLIVALADLVLGDHLEEKDERRD